MDQQQLIAYFDRIGLDEEPTRDIAGIGMMQRAHLETVPFENLDILAGKVPLDLSEEGLFDKIVVRGRGGICYELNFLYAAALHALGFDLELRGGRIYDDGDEFDHVFLMVTDPDNPASDPWITDVGFAYNIAAPIRFTPGIVQDDGRCQYRIDEIDVDGESWYHVIRIVNGDESLMFAFRDVATHAAPSSRPIHRRAFSRVRSYASMARRAVSRFPCAASRKRGMAWSPNAISTILTSLTNCSRMSSRCALTTKRNQMSLHERGWHRGR